MGRSASTPVSAPVGRWVVACTAGELLGFGAAASWAWLAWRVFGPDPAAPAARAAVVATMVLAGVCEGAVLGWLQWRVLRVAFPSLPARGWIGATIAVAALGWLLGMLPSALSGAGSDGGGWEPAAGTAILLAVGFGAAVGAVFGAAQWMVLRRHAPRASRWIVANAAGWAAGLPWSYAAGSAGDVSRGVGVAVAIGAGAGALMGLSVAIATGVALRGMTR